MPWDRLGWTPALGDLDWSNKTITVRVNALDSPFTYLDVVAFLEALIGGSHRFVVLTDGVDVDALDLLVTQVERNVERREPVGFDVMIESTQG